MVKFQNIISRKSKPPFQKQLFADVLQSRCSKTLRNIRRKTPALESLFNSWSSSGLLSCEYCNIFKDRFFHKTCPVAVSALYLYLSKLLLRRPCSYFVYFNSSKQAT